MIINYSPSTNRTLGSIADVRSRGEIAFYLGAGVDKAIISDSCPNTDIKNWQELIYDLTPNIYKSGLNRLYDLIPNKYKSGLKRPWLKSTYDELAKWWPTEMAFYPKIRLGENSFHKKIRKILVKKINPIITETSYTWKLVSLLSSSNMIVTTNYTPYIEQALNIYLNKERPGYQLIVLNREDLPSFLFPQPEIDPKLIYFIYLHGRVTTLTKPILDSWGYNVIQNDDIHYQSFLNDLFSKRSVLTLGVSWTDIPIRNATAFVKRTKPYLGQHHLALMHHDGGDNKINFLNHSAGPYRYWSVAMRGCYGVDVVPFVNEAKEDLLDRILLLHKLSKPDKLNEKKLTEIAEFLDSQGDYESPLHHKWLKHSGTPKDDLKKIADKTISHVKSNPDFWPTAAKLEKHLRHHLYLYRQDDIEIRPQLWKAVSDASIKNPKLANDDPRLWFDLFIGKFELNQPLNPKIEKEWMVRISADRVLSDRIEFAQKVWLERPNKNLIPRLMDIGWESIAAKVALDCAKVNAKAEKPDHSKVYDQAVQGAQLAMAAGCRRRQVLGDVLSALWHRDPKEARSLILGRCLSDSDDLEQGLKDGLATAIIACNISANNDRKTVTLDGKDLDLWVKSAGLPYWDRKNVKDFWLKLVPKQIANTLQKIL